MLVKKAVILAKLEVTEGTDPTPTAAADALLITQPAFTLNAATVERDIVQATLSPTGFVVGTRTATVTFQTEVRGLNAGSFVRPSAASPIHENPLFIACGMSPSYSAGSCVYNPVSDFTGKPGFGTAYNNSATIYAYLDGVLFILTNCHGNLEITSEANQYAKYNWTIRDAGTKKSIDCNFGTTPNSVVITVPNAQLGTPVIGDRNTIRTYELPFIGTGNSGDDECSIKYA